MTVTIKDLSKKTGYTIATISRALNDSPLVKDKTKKEILDAAEEIGYVRNDIARGLVKKNSSTFGVIVPDITNPYFPLLVKGIQDALLKEGYHIFLCNSDWDEENEKRLINMLCESRVKGILMDPISDHVPQILSQIGFPVPVVYLGNRPSDENANYVIIDNYKGARKATEYLIELGHERIAFIGAEENTFINRSRSNGYRDTMIKSFGGLDESLVRKSKYKRENANQVIREMIEEGNVPTAVVACNDIIALGVMEAFQSSSFRVPEDVSVIGFDDIEYASLPGINLTTVREPRYQMGTMATEIILECIKDRNTKRQIIIEPELILRKTCTRRVS